MSFPKDVLEEAAAALDAALKNSVPAAASSEAAGVTITAHSIGTVHTAPVVIVEQTVRMDGDRQP